MAGDDEAPAVSPPWPVAEVANVPKKEVIEFLQAHATLELLQTHRLTGQPKNVAKNTKGPALEKAYREAVEAGAWATEAEREAARAEQDRGKERPAAQAESAAGAPSSETPPSAPATPLFTKRVKKKGRGTYPEPGAKVQVHYTGKLEDGTVFDSTTTDPKTGKRRAPLVFKVGMPKPAVIAGWDAAVLKMSVGEIAEITIPPEHAYGKKGVPGMVPPDATLIFEMELTNIM